MSAVPATGRVARRDAGVRLSARVRAVPAVLWAVFLVAFCCGTGWAVLTPPFQVPDETEHFAYVQYFAETGDLPGQSGRPRYSAEQTQAMRALGTTAIIGRSTIGVRDDPSDASLKPADRAPRGDGGGPMGASQQPPLYYVLAAVPYRLFTWASLPARILAVRMLSVLFFAAAATVAAALTAELLPKLAVAPLVGGMAIALQPVMGFIAGGVSPDALLSLVAVTLLLVMVKGLRRPSPGAVAAIALVTGAALVTKLTAVAFVPAAALAILIIVWRLRREGEARRTLAVAIAAGVLLPLVYAVWTTAIGRGLVPEGASTATLPLDRIRAPSSLEEASYIWQLYLPRVPWQTNLFGFWPPADLWLRGLLGVYGWLDYSVPGWLFNVGKVVTVAILALCASAALQRWRALRRHWVEIVVLGVFAVGLGLVIGFAGYEYRRTTGFLFEQARYLFPVAGLGAVIAALATAGLGRRPTPYVAALLLGTFAALEVSGVLLTFARYYG
jgi:4-amino-4-deoxy-L-arabinose transferase-like glycosyltransferase